MESASSVKVLQEMCAAVLRVCRRGRGRDRLTVRGPPGEQQRACLWRLEVRNNGCQQHKCSIESQFAPGGYFSVGGQNRKGAFGRYTVVWRKNTV